MLSLAAMANPIQQGLKLMRLRYFNREGLAAMANPIQQGLKLKKLNIPIADSMQPQWLIQYNKD